MSLLCADGLISPSTYCKHNKFKVYISAEKRVHPEQIIKCCWVTVLNPAFLCAFITLRWSRGLWCTAGSAGSSRFSVGGGGTGTAAGGRKRGGSRSRARAGLQVLRKDVFHLVIHITWRRTRAGNNLERVLLHFKFPKDQESWATTPHLPYHNRRQPRPRPQQAEWNWLTWACFHRSFPRSFPPPDSWSSLDSLSGCQSTCQGSKKRDASRRSRQRF